MARLSKTLVTLAGRVVFERHRDEAKTEAYQLRRTLERLLTRGATVATPRPTSCIPCLFVASAPNALWAWRVQLARQLAMTAWA